MHGILDIADPTHVKTDEYVGALGGVNSMQCGCGRIECDTCARAARQQPLGQCCTARYPELPRLLVTHSTLSHNYSRFVGLCFGCQIQQSRRIVERCPVTMLAQGCGGLNRWLCCGRTQQVQLLVELWNHTQPWPRTSTRGLGGTWAMHVA